MGVFLEVNTENFLKTKRKNKWQKKKKYSGYGYHGGGRKPKGDKPKTTTMSIVVLHQRKRKLKSLQKIAVYQFPVLFLQQLLIFMRMN